MLKHQQDLRRQQTGPGAEAVRADTDGEVGPVHHAFLLYTTADQRSLYTFLCFSPRFITKILGRIATG